MRAAMDLKKHIRGIPDFPTPGILFYDISPLLAHPQAWQATVDRLSEVVHRHEPDVLAGIESRGFLVAAPLALRLNQGFVMVRKKGKIGREHVLTPVTNAPIVCRLLLQKKKPKKSHTA